MKNKLRIMAKSLITAASFLWIGVFVIALILGVTGGLLYLFSPAANAEGFETWYVGAEDGLNLRTEPTTDSNVITLYPFTTELQIIGIDSSGEWWETYDGTRQGWVCAQYMVQTQGANRRGHIGEFIHKCTATVYTPDPAENNGYSVNCFDEALPPLVGQIVAVDPRYIPLHRLVYIEGVGIRETRDTGVLGWHVDILENYEQKYPKTERNVYLWEE